MKLEVGMYVRTKDGKIGKYFGEKAYETNKVCIWTETTKEGIKVTPIIDKNTISKTSYNIIDILEVGDYVNGFRVEYVYNPTGNKVLWIKLSCNPIDNYENKDIKSIITKEQFEQMSYKVGEKDNNNK